MRFWLTEMRGNRSQKEIADAVGISRGAYCNIEIGKRNPSVEVAKRIAEVLDFNWVIFFDDDVNESKQKETSA